MKHTDKHFHIKTIRMKKRNEKPSFLFNNQQPYFPSSKSHYVVVLQNGKQMRIIPG
jgi:hypothetical protein